MVALPHKRSPEKWKMKQEAWDAFLTRKAAIQKLLNSSFWDRQSAELICRTSRVEIMSSLTSSAGSAVEGVDVSQVPDVIHGEVLQDTRGQGTLQKSESQKETKVQV